jgi:hypothetical protein
MKKEHESKAVRIRRLILLEGASDAAIAKTVKCHVSYVWQVRKKLEKDIDADRGAKETLAHVRKITAAADTGVPPRDEIAEWKARNDGTPFVGSGVKEIFKQAAVDFNKILDKEYAAEKSILAQAQDIIYGDREKTYGAPDKNLKAIAGYWANHLHTRFGVYHDVTPEDVCIMMVLLKAARLGNDITHRDSQVDAVGYLALMERIQK